MNSVTIQVTSMALHWQANESPKSKNLLYYCSFLISDAAQPCEVQLRLFDIYFATSHNNSFETPSVRFEDLWMRIRLTRVIVCPSLPQDMADQMGCKPNRFSKLFGRSSISASSVPPPYTSTLVNELKAEKP